MQDDAKSKVNDDKPDMVHRQSWDEFRSCGLLWWVNRLLHCFGWAICVTVDESGKVTDCFPARCRFRGFDTDSEEEGYRRITNHLADNIDQLKKDLET